MKKEFLIVLFIPLFVAFGCKMGDKGNSVPSNAPANRANTNTATVKTPTTTTSDSDDSGYAQSLEPPVGKTIPEPASGMGQVWGQVMFNSKPVEKIEVRLCEKLTTILGIDCTGKTYKTSTNADGEYFIQNVPPGEYGGLIVKVFTSNFYVYEASSFGSIAKKYKIEAGKTFFVTDSNLFKNDLKPLTPKAGSKTPSQGLQLTWAEYPDAEYYEVSLMWAGKEYKSSTVVNEHVEGTNYSPTEPLEDGTYYYWLTAFNSDGKKIAQSSREYKITITGGSPPAAAK